MWKIGAKEISFIIIIIITIAKSRQLTGAMHIVISDRLAD